MCWNCFKEYADGPVVNERVQSAFDVMERTKGPRSTAGLWLPPSGHDLDGSLFLHIIVGDMNVDDCFFDLDDEDRRMGYDAAEQWERDVFDALANLTEEERATAVAMEWGYISRDGTLRADLVAVPS